MYICIYIRKSFYTNIFEIHKNNIQLTTSVTNSPLHRMVIQPDNFPPSQRLVQWMDDGYTNES